VKVHSISMCVVKVHFAVNKKIKKGNKEEENVGKEKCR
jgi:hypothetical protein